jgi:hypothetical protein
MMFDEVSGARSQMDFDLVTLRVRTGHDEKFQYDSVTYVISSKKGLHVNRFLADRAMKQNALEWNPGTGEVMNATIYIEEDVDTQVATPSDALAPEMIAALKDTDGLGDDTILIDGKAMKKKTLDFRNKYDKKHESFTGNNTI